MREKKGVSIFGRFFSNRELFWNGIAFLLIGVIYEALVIGNQLPTNWKEDIESVGDVDSGWFISTMFFVISYLLLDRRFFGSNLENIIKKTGKFIAKKAIILLNKSKIAV